MKKLLIIIALFICATTAQAQIVYQPFVPNSSSSSSSSNYESQATTMRTNGVYEENGEYYKMPLKVAVSDGGTYSLPSVQVVAYYQYNDYTGGNWLNLYNTGVMKCNGGGVYGNPLEKQFMYKVYIIGNTVYFDL